MRVVMIHAIAESIPPVKLAFSQVFPEAELINLLDEGLFIDYRDHITPTLRRRMSQMIGYASDYGADAIGLACSVYAPVVETARLIVDVPLEASYSPVMAEAVRAGRRIGIIAANSSTLRDAEDYLRQTAAEQLTTVEPILGLADDLIPVLRTEGEAGFRRRLEEEVLKLAPEVDAVVLGQFSMASEWSYLQRISPVPVLSGPHSSARRLKELLLTAVQA